MCLFFSCGANFECKENTDSTESENRQVCRKDSVVDWFYNCLTCPCVNNIDGSLADDWFIEAVLYICRHIVIYTGRISVARLVAH